MAMTFAEKRLFPRVGMKMPLRYQFRGKSEFHNTVSENLSTGGLGCISDKFIAPNTYLMLEFNVLSRAITPVGRVAWASPMPHTDRYQMGIEFSDMDRNTQHYMRDYIDMRMGKL